MYKSSGNDIIRLITERIICTDPFAGLLVFCLLLSTVMLSQYTKLLQVVPSIANRLSEQLDSLLCGEMTLGYFVTLCL